MTENALSILSVIFSVQLQQTEISERKLFIFHLSVETWRVATSALSVTISALMWRFWRYQCGVSSDIDVEFLAISVIVVLV